MLDLLERFWIAFPLSYALTVGGLVTGYQRGGVPEERRLPRALLTAFPVLAVTILLWDSITGIIESGIDYRPFRGLHDVLCLIFLISASALAGSVLARAKPQNLLRRGSVLFEHDSEGASVPQPDSLTLAGRPLALLDETKHFKIIGTTGTGKSTAIRELLSGALHRGDRAVIADPDGGYARSFYNPDRGDIILNPFDSRAARWDLFAEMTEPQDADHLARSFIPDCEGSERIWRGFGQTYVSGILAQMRRTKEHDLATLYHTLVQASEDDLRDLLAGTPAARFIGKDGGKFLESVQSVVIHHMGSLAHLAQQSQENSLSVRRWIREGKGVLFLTYQANQIASLRSLISAWMRLAIYETMSAPEGDDQRLWFVIDELDALGAIDGLKDALTRLRKFGGRCILGFQSIAQVRGTYGDADAQTIVENCGNTVILRCSASERGGTAEFASRLIGKREVIRQQHSKSRVTGHLFRRTHTVSDQISVEDAVMASEIEQLPDLSGYLKLTSHPHWFRMRLSHGQ